MNTSISNPAVSSENRQFGFWGRLSLPLKLLLAFSIIFVLALAIAGLTLWGMNRVQTDYEQALSQGKEVQRLSDALLIFELQARRAEKNFLLRWQSEGYDTAYENYITLTPVDLGTRGPTVLMSVASMDDYIQQLAPFGAVAATVSTGDMTQAQYEADLASLSQYTDTYKQKFLALAEANKQYGSDENTGLQGNVRDAAHAIETKVYDKTGLENLAITMLQIRRREKDYLARKDQVYVDDVHTLITQLKVQVAASELLQPTEKTELRTLADQYKTEFDVIVAKDAEIAALNDEMVAAARAIEPVAAKIETLGEQLAKDNVTAAEADSARIFTISMVTIAISLMLTIFISIALSRQITRPVTQLTKTAGEIAGGNFEVQAEISSGDEIGTLAQTFNSMTSRLRQAFEDVRRRALAVQTSAEVSRRLTVATNSRQLAVDVVEQVQSAFNYYHAHIYTVDDATGDMIMTGGTGEAGATMLARGHKIPKGRGLVGRAAETNAPILVPDVSKAEGWLPNPLLPDTKSEVAIPISSGNTVLGVLDVQQNVVNGLGEEDVELLQSLAGQVAISLQNVRTFEESRTKAELETLVNVIGQKIQRTTSIEETLQTAIRELGMAIGASRVQAAIGAVRTNGGNNAGQNQSGQSVEE